MVKYHPETRYLTEYAAGSLSRPIALCVAVHLHYCPLCRSKVRDLTTVGTALFLRQTPTPVDGGAFERLMARIDGLPPRGGQAPGGDLGNSGPAMPILPTALFRLTQGDLGKLRWRSLSKSYRFAPLQAGDEKLLTSLVHIRAGGTAPQHRHTGEEITVVLRGSFSDREDHYHQGDFIVRSAGEKHRPVAAQHEDCLCLTATEAPISMTNWLYRLLQPLMNLRIA